jgi:acyl carrier protein
LALSFWLKKLKPDGDFGQLAGDQRHGGFMDRVVEVFASTLKLDRAAISDETAPDNTPEWDSIAAMDLALAIQDEFGVKLGTRDILAMRSVGLVKKVLRAKGIADV